MDWKLSLVCLSLCISFITSIPVGPDSDIVVTTDKPAKSNEGSKETSLDVVPPKIYEMDIKSNVSNRFAHTTVTSKVKNVGKKAHETTFFVVLPDSAYISSFIMEIGGTNYTAYVKSKEEAKQTYEEAIQHGQSAAHVAVSARDSNKFAVNMNIEPESKAIFYLTYEELLERTDGSYELIINIHPKQLVKNLNVEVDIDESRPLKFVKAPPLRTGNEIKEDKEELDPRATVQVDGNKATVKFSPNDERQKQIAQSMGGKEDEGIAGQFVVQYEVERDPSGGEVLVKDGYFVHFFAPSDLKPLKKHIVFVLDTSGSMYEPKLMQLKTAMKNIFGDLNEEDTFNLVEFNTDVKVWNLDAPSESTRFPEDMENSWGSSDKVYNLTGVSFAPAYPVNKKNLDKAQKAVSDLYATGGTNIFEALRVAIHLVKLGQQRSGNRDRQPMIVFLTDGDPTVGKTNQNDITSGIQEENIAKIPIYSLSFGAGADRTFLEKLSLKNFGFARHIYEDSDATIQLENFYKEISSPLLHDVKFKYTPDATSLTQVDFPLYFKGSEFIVSGVVPLEGFKETPMVSCIDLTGQINLKPTIRKSVGELERLWAYMTVKKYLDAKKVADNATIYEEKAKDLALKYSFVTPVTSLVVVKPNSTSALNTEAADGSVPTDDYQYGSSFSNAGAAGFGGVALGVPGGGAYSSNSFQPLYMVAHTTKMQTYAITDSAAGESDDRDSGYMDIRVSASFIPQSVPQAYDIDLASTPEEGDRIIGGTEDLHPSLPSTTTQLPEPFTLPPELKSNFAWLEPLLNTDGSLTFLKGHFTLGLNETTPANLECTDPNSESGFCTLLKDCEVLIHVVTDTTIFKNYFCSIQDKYAGVCCPPKK